MGFFSLRPCLISITYNFRFNEPHFQFVDLKTTLGSYAPQPHSLYQHRVKIRREIAALDPTVSQKAIFEVRSGAQKSLAAHGGHF